MLIESRIFSAADKDVKNKWITKAATQFGRICPARNIELQLVMQAGRWQLPMLSRNGEHTIALLAPKQGKSEREAG